MIRLLLFFLSLNIFGSELIREKCSDCHDKDTKKGQFDIEFLLDNQHEYRNNKLLRAYKAVLKNEMPPKKKLSEVERNKLLVFLHKKERKISNSRYLTPDEIKNTFNSLRIRFGV